MLDIRQKVPAAVNGHPIIRSRRKWKLAAFAFAAFAVAATASLWVCRIDLAETALVRLLDRRGMGPAKLTISRLDLFGARAHDISLYAGAVRIADIGLDYRPLHAIAGIVDRAEITRLRVEMVAAGDKVTIGGAPLASANTADGGSPIGSLPITTISLVDANVAFQSPAGRFEAMFSTDLALSGADIRNTALAADIAVPVAGAVRWMHVVVPEFVLTPQDKGGLQLAFGKAAIRPKDFPWFADELGGEFLWRGERLLAKISSGRISSLLIPALAEPIGFSGEVTMVGSRIDFIAHAAIEPVDASGRISLDAKGHHDRMSGDGRLSLAIPPVVFQSKGLQPRNFFPVVGNALPGMAGSAALSGDVAWHGGVLSPELILRLADIAFEPDGARFSSIRGDIKLDGIWPLSTASGQILHGVIESGGLPPARSTLTFQLLPDPALRIEGMQMDYVGGQISVSPFVIDPKSPDIETVVALRQVDLAEVFKLVGIDSLSGTGRLDGRIPLQVVGGDVIVGDGKLAASGPGVLRLGGDMLPKQITEAGQSMTLVLEALADFHYDTLTIDLARRTGGDGTIKLGLHGNNPAVLDGQPFILNIKLDSNFDRLIDLALKSMAAAQALLRQTAGSTHL